MLSHSSISARVQGARPPSTERDQASCCAASRASATNCGGTAALRPARQRSSQVSRTARESPTSCSGAGVERVRTLDATVDLSAGFHVEEIEGTERFWDADLVVMAIGYAGPETEALEEQTAVTLDPRGRVQATDYVTADDGVFVAGDARRGASLVVWALSEGREAARAVDVYLRGASPLPLKGAGDQPRG